MCSASSCPWHAAGLSNVGRPWWLVPFADGVNGAAYLCVRPPITVPLWLLQQRPSDPAWLRSERLLVLHISQTASRLPSPTVSEVRKRKEAAARPAFPARRQQPVPPKICADLHQAGCVAAHSPTHRSWPLPFYTYARGSAGPGQKNESERRGGRREADRRGQETHERGSEKQACVRASLCIRK